MADPVVRLATRQNASLETMIADDVYFPADEAAAAAPTGVADDARGAPDEAAAAALDEAAAPETKRRRAVSTLGFRCVPRPLPMWFREPTTQRLHQPLDPPSLITQC